MGFYHGLGVHGVDAELPIDVALAFLRLAWTPDVDARAIRQWQMDCRGLLKTSRFGDQEFKFLHLIFYPTSF